jgi:hypothetical protein
MVVVTENEVSSTIAVLTKNREKGLDHVILHRGMYGPDGRKLNPELSSVMGICNADQSIIVPMFNWPEDEVRNYLTSPMQQVSIDVMSDENFAFFYTWGRRATWKNKRSNFMADKEYRHNNSAYKGSIT